MSSAWAGKEDFLEEGLCDRACRAESRGKGSRWAGLRGGELCWESHGEPQAQGTGREAGSSPRSLGFRGWRETELLTLFGI